MKKPDKLNRKSIIEVIWFWFGILFLTGYVLLPLFNMLLASVKPLAEIQMTGKSILPKVFDFGTYVRMWKTVDLINYIKNSFIIIVSSTVLSVVISILAGYALNRFSFKGKSIFEKLLVGVQMLPGIIFLLPIYLMYVVIQNTIGVQFVGTYKGVIITYLTFALPLSIWMMKGYFKAIPNELEEAAFIDGCNYARFIFKILLPLSMPGVIAVAIYSFLLGWEEVLFASILTNEGTRTVAVGLRNYASIESTYWNEMMAASVTVSLPIVGLFLLLQRYLIAGLTAGSVKG